LLLLYSNVPKDIAHVLLFVFQFLRWPTKSSPFAGDISIFPAEIIVNRLDEIPLFDG
jgi:hypothetical protein